MGRAAIWCLGVGATMIVSLAGRGLCAEAAGLSAAELAKAKTAAHAYLKALAEDDRAELKKMRPRDPAHRYGPYPFAGMPTLGRPTVDAHRAGLEFQGKATDATLPPRGAIILTKEDRDPEEPWKVNSIIWYEKRPRGVKIPKTSATRDDAAQEPRVLRAVKSYLEAWRKQDWDRVEVLTFDWFSYTPAHSTRAGLKSAELSLTPMPGDEVRVDFTARVVFLRIIPKTVTGRLFCMRENGVWKVRGQASLL